MDAAVRRPFQGITNIVRFNWHFYVVASIVVFLLVVISAYGNNFIFWSSIAIAAGIVASTSVSLLVSYYVYDRSNLYDFAWLAQLNHSGIKKIANVHAGFDETSVILENNFASAELKVFDFYDPSKHTEVSIERARKAYPPYDRTVRISTSTLPLTGKEVDVIFNIFALHEVRNRDERITFLNEQRRALSDDGRIVIVEHLRDLPNLLAYNIGFFHFLSKREWNENFREAGLCVDKEFKVTPFVTVFILRKPDGNTR